MIVTLVGWLGADAKETDKGGFSFSLSQKNWENSVESTIWISCYQNYMNGVFPFMKKGTAVQIIGDMNIGVYNHPEKGPVPTANCRVLHIDLLPSKNKENQG